jgi:hypothetical protein
MGECVRASLSFCCDHGALLHTMSVPFDFGVALELCGAETYDFVLLRFVSRDFNGSVALSSIFL